MKVILRSLLFLLVAINSSASAGVFNIPHFTAPGSFAVGLEPEFTLNNGANAAINVRYSHGLNELNNFHAILGTGGVERAFRFGGAYSFDFFPDVPKQPGIGLALQALYINRFDSGGMEITTIPYIHKSLTAKGATFEPFMAFPVGISLANGRYHYIGTLAFGSLFQHNEHFNSIVEVGIKMNNSDTYISGGLVYNR